MSRGRLIRPLKATFAQLDTAAIGTATNYDDELREVKKTDSNSDGIGETQRVEKAELTIDVQIESNSEERQRIERGVDLGGMHGAYYLIKALMSIDNRPRQMSLYSVAAAI